MASANSFFACATALRSVSRSSIDAPRTLAGTCIPLKPSGCAAQEVCAQWCAAVPSGRAATSSSASGTTALTSPMSEEAVAPCPGPKGITSVASPDCATPTSFCTAFAKVWSLSSKRGAPTRSSSFCITLPTTELLTGSGSARPQGELVLVAREPGEPHVAVLEGRGKDHEGLACQDPLGRRAEDLEGARQLLIGAGAIRRHRRCDGRRAQEVVAAAVPRSV